MKIALSGGHFAPAHAFIEEVSSSHKVLVLGRKYVFENDSTLSFEYETCKKEGIPFQDILTGRLQRKFSLSSILALFKIPIGFFQSLYYLRIFKADIFVGFGGYLSVPIAYAAYVLGIPVVIHEQTQKAGLANKMLANIAQKIFISFESSKEYFPQEKVFFTGNPIRKNVLKVDQMIVPLRGKKLIYTTGGSAGSHFINVLVHEIIEALVKENVVIHQTGQAEEFNDFSLLQARRKKLPQNLQDNYIIKKFIDPKEIGWVFKNATLVISRSGINTVLELLTLGKVSLLIPLSTGQTNEQIENAKLIKKVGLGEYMTEDEITPEKLLASIKKLLKNHELYEKNAKQAQLTFVPDASKRISDVIQSIYEKKTGKKTKIAS